MTDKLQAEIDRGHRAKNILEDGLFQEAKSHIESELYRLFSEAKPDDQKTVMFVKGIQYLHFKYLAFLNAAVRDGKVAQLKVEEESKLRRALRKVVG